MDRRGATLLHLWLMASTIALCMANMDWDQSCGSLCKCKWVSGKKTAECVRQKLTHVPKDLSSEIQILDLAGNHIPYLPHDAFRAVNLINLNRLFLRECEIASIDTDAFNGLKIAIEIDLAANKIKQLFPGTFVSTQRLRILRLNDNDLEFLENGLFQDLIYLQKIVLSNNYLARIGERSFLNLPGLQILQLDGNNLTSISHSTFNNLSKLSSLELHNNPWNCNCHLKKFRDWTLERRLYTRPTRCKEPEDLADKMWDDLNSEDFDCRPKIMVGHRQMLENGRSNLKFWCRTFGTPAQLSWLHGSRILNNSRKHQNHQGDQRYVLVETNEWLNLTILNASSTDKGDYVCVADSPDGRIEQIVSLTNIGGNQDGTIDKVSLQLGLGIGITLLLLLLIGLVGFVWYCKKRRTGEGNKSAEGNSLENLAAGKQDRSFNSPENSGKRSYGSYGNQLNKILLDSDSVFAVGPRTTSGTAAEEGHSSTRDLEQSTMSRGASYRHIPPDLLAFSAGRAASPTSQASTALDNSRLVIPLLTGEQEQSVRYGSPTEQYGAGFRTLPHKRAGLAASPQYNSGLAAMLKQGYVTIPRKPKGPSWENGPPTSPTLGPIEGLEPIYDNLGARTTADGSSVLSLNKSSEAGSSSTMRGRPLPRTPTGNLHYKAIQRSTPNILTSSPIDRAAPEGMPGWPAKLPDEMNKRIMQHVDTRSLGRKQSPRPPPKPDMKSLPDPLFEDEGEDGTEV